MGQHQQLLKSRAVKSLVQAEGSATGWFSGTSVGPLAQIFEIKAYWVEEAYTFSTESPAFLWEKDSYC